MSSIISIFVLLLSLSFFFIDRSTKLKIILLSILCLNFASFNYVSFGRCPSMLCLFFFLSELKYIKEYIRELSSTPFIWLMTWMSIGVIILILTSIHANSLVVISSLIISDLVCKYFVIAYIYVAYKGKNELLDFYKIGYYSVIIITIFGLITLITGLYPAQILIDNLKNIHQFSELGRIRITSLFMYPFDYGFACNLMLIIFLYGKSKSLISTERFIIATLCCLIGILICGCRTIFFTSIISVLTFLFVKNSTFKALGYILFTSYFVLILLLTSNSFNNKINGFLSVLDYEHSERGSSSLSGREMQYLAVFKFISGKELTGRGYRFLKEDLGFNKNGNGQADLEGEARNLLGLEGAIMAILLERGYVGVLFYLTFYLTVIIYALKLRKRAPAEIAVVLACIIGFISYGNMTGELSSAVITLFLSGIFLKQARLNNEKYVIELDE